MTKPDPVAFRVRMPYWSGWGLWNNMETNIEQHEYWLSKGAEIQYAYLLD